MDRRRSKPKPSARRAPTYPIPKPLYARTSYPSRLSGRQRRFNTRSFNRNNLTTVPGSTISKTTNLKLSYTKQWESAISNTSTWSTPSTSGRTYPIDTQASSILFLGSHFCTPLGNPRRPPAMASGFSGSVASILEDFPTGLTNWSGFYDQGLCYGSSINITVCQSGAASTATFRYVLIPISCQNFTDIAQPNSLITGLTYTTLRAQMDALDLVSAMSYPGALTGYVKNVYTGPTYIKAFRKTKDICNLSDIRDNQEELAMNLPPAATPETGTNTPNAIFNNAIASSSQTGWVWYFRVYSDTTGSTVVFDFTVRIKYYASLQDRKPFEQVTSPAP